MWRKNQQQQQKVGPVGSPVGSRRGSYTDRSDDNVVTVSEIFELKQAAIELEEKKRISGRSHDDDEDNNSPGNTKGSTVEVAAMAAKPGAFAVSVSSSATTTIRKVERHNMEQQQHGNHHHEVTKKDEVAVATKPGAVPVSSGFSTMSAMTRKIEKHNAEQQRQEASSTTTSARTSNSKGDDASSSVYQEEIANYWEKELSRQSGLDLFAADAEEAMQQVVETAEMMNDLEAQDEDVIDKKVVPPTIIRHHITTLDPVPTPTEQEEEPQAQQHRMDVVRRLIGSHRPSREGPHREEPPELSPSSHPFVNPSRRQQDSPHSSPRTYVASHRRTPREGQHRDEPPELSASSVHSTVSIPGAFAESGPSLMESGTAERRSSAVEEVLRALAHEQEEEQNCRPSSLPEAALAAPNAGAHHTGNSELKRKKSSGFLVEASAVSDIEAVFEAEEVQRDFYHRNQILIIISCILIGILLIVTLSVVLTRPDPSPVPLVEVENRTGDPRCWVPVEDQSVDLRCYCGNTTQGFYDQELTYSEQGFYHVMMTQLEELGIVNKTEVSGVDSCHPANIVGLRRSNLDALNITIDGANAFPIRVQVYIFILEFLYITMVGVDWSLDDTWLTNKGVCSWTGVDCMFVNVIHRLALSNMDLGGTIPSELQHLNTLRYLDLSDNPGVTGTIPSELAKLSALMTLDLSGIGMTGTIPLELLELSQLDTLRLSSNHLTGSIPVVSSSSLSSSNGENTTTVAASPVDSSALQSMDLSRNSLTGSIPSRIGYMPRLQWLRLEGNQFSGVLPTELGMLTALEMLNLGNNRFTGTIPDFLGHLPRLAMLNLYESGFTGKIPESFCEEATSTAVTSDSDVAVADVGDVGGSMMSRFRQIIVDCRLVTEDCSCCSRSPQDITATVEVQCGESLSDFSLGL